MSATKYAATPFGRLGFTVSDGMVWVTSRTANFGGYKVERFGELTRSGNVTSAGIRSWVEFAQGTHVSVTA